MRLSFFIASSALLFAACSVDTTGLSEESSRAPKGNPAASVVVTEYADLQCPACKAAQDSIVQPLLEEYGDRIAFEFKHFPLRSIHRFALEAAEAAECAADQGAFWEYHDVIYARQDMLSSAALRSWAGELGLDEELFDRCVSSGVKRKTILTDFEEGRNAGVQGTPTFFINGERVDSQLGVIREQIDAILNRGSVAL